MRKISTLLALVCLCSVASAQVIGLPLNKSQQRIGKSKTGNHQKGPLIRPFSGKDYFDFDGDVYQDSTSFTRTYHSNGRVKTQIDSDIISGQKVSKIVSTFDSKGYEDIIAFYDWDGAAFIYNSEYGSIKKYDSQNRLLTILDYEKVESDSNFATHGFVRYTADSCIIKAYDYQSTAPGKLIRTFLTWTSPGSTSKYDQALDTQWDPVVGAYAIISHTKINWNGEFAAERIFKVIENDILFDYMEFKQLNQGVDYAGKGVGVFSTTKDENQYSQLINGSYVPLRFSTLNYDSYRNVTLYRVQDEYNVNSKTFEAVADYQSAYTYAQGNMTKEVYGEGTLDSPYQEVETWVYSNFKDLTGITSVNATSTIKAFPNPTRNTINFFLGNQGAKVQLFNMLGAEISINAVLAGEKTSVDLSNIPAGFYVVTINSDDVSERQVIEVIH